MRAGFGFPLERRQGVDGIAVEIVTRHQRVSVSLSSKEAPDVSAIFQQERIRFVLGMALEEDEEAFELFYKCVDACLC